MGKRGHSKQEEGLEQRRGGRNAHSTCRCPQIGVARQGHGVYEGKEQGQDLNVHVDVIVRTLSDK